MIEKNGITIYILDHEFKIGCPEGKEQELRNSAHYLDSKMREIRSQGCAIGLERIAIIAALNFAHELLSPASAEDLITERRIQALQEQIDSVLSRTRLLEIKEDREETLLALE